MENAGPSSELLEIMDSSKDVGDILTLNNQENSEDDFQSTELDVRQSRRVYLITYSKANTKMFPTRESFATAVAVAFAKTGAEISHWACCLENHKDNGIHYHMIISTSKLRRWKSVKDYLAQKYRIVVNFSDKSLGYVAGYRYICKSDAAVLHSANHTDLQNIGSPRTKTCMSVNRTKNSVIRRSSENKRSSLEPSKGGPPEKKKSKRLTFTDVGEYILDNNIRSYTSLQAIAMRRREEGEKDLFGFLARNTSKNVQDLIERVWSMRDASNKENEVVLSRLEKLSAAGNQECRPECIGKWL